MALYDFSRLLSLTDYDKVYSLNISVFLTTVYFNIFKDHRLFKKLNLPSKFLYVFSERFEHFCSLDLNRPNIDEISTHKTLFDPVKKKQILDFTISIGKDSNRDKYKPYYMKIYLNEEDIKIYFPLSISWGISIDDENFKTPQPEIGLRYYKNFFIKKLPIISILSMDKESSDIRKKKIKTQKIQQ